MKLRIQEHSVRFRLSPGDITELQKNNRLSRQLDFSTHCHWCYEISLSASQTETSFMAEHTTLSVIVPAKKFLNWLDSHAIEWEYEQNSPKLQIVIEKDLKPQKS
jgi:hypothetical protein